MGWDVTLPFLLRSSAEVDHHVMCCGYKTGQCPTQIRAVFAWSVLCWKSACWQTPCCSSITEGISANSTCLWQELGKFEAPVVSHSVLPHQRLWELTQLLISKYKQTSSGCTNSRGGTSSRSCDKTGVWPVQNRGILFLPETLRARKMESAENIFLVQNNLEVRVFSKLILFVIWNDGTGHFLLL